MHKCLENKYILCNKSTKVQNSLRIEPSQILLAKSAVKPESLIKLAKCMFSYIQVGVKKKKKVDVIVPFRSG